MEFGWYHEFHRQVPGQSDADAFEQGFRQAEDAERWGLDVFWLAEIHQQAPRPGGWGGRSRASSPPAPNGSRSARRCTYCR